MATKAIGGPAGAKEAFDRLESKLKSLRGRRFYGAYDRIKGEYRACVEATPSEEAVSLGLESWIIPGGRYITLKVGDWNSRIPQLPRLFDEMGIGRLVDPTRPSLEYYRSQSELVLYLPVKE